MIRFDNTGRTLRVFDFDGTLYKELLGQWNEPLVAKVRESYRDGGVYSVLITGRLGHFMGPHTKRLLDEKGLKFKEVIFSNSLDTVGFKKQQLARLVRTIHPRAVEMWDDREDYLAEYGKLLKTMGIPYRLKAVR